MVQDYSDRYRSREVTMLRPSARIFLRVKIMREGIVRRTKNYRFSRAPGTCAKYRGHVPSDSGEPRDARLSKERE